MKENQQHHTILDLAAALKLSPATISRALNNTSYVKKETKERILAMALKLGYRKNTMAAGLRNNKTNTIGLILPKISMYFHAEVVTVVQNLLHAEGYNLIIGQSNDDPAMEKELAETFFSSRVDAVIVSCTLQTEDFSHFDIFSAHHIPILFYDRVPPDHYHARVIQGDDFNGGFLAGKHLAEAGCKHLGMINGPMTSNIYEARAAGYIAALKFFGVNIRDAFFFHQQLNTEETLKALKKLFSGKTKPDGLFVTSDRSAVTVLQFAKEKGISIPDELMLVGYSNDPITAVVSPSITTIDQFPSLFGHKLVETLLEMMHNAQSNEHIPAVVTPVKLIERESSEDHSLFQVRKSNQHRKLNTTEK
jgi:DNA-binding LacI/PurR family transcriptional regulator